MARIPILFDTDIGTDVDDLFALAFALGCPEFDLVGITTVFGEPRKRAQIVQTFLQAAGRTDIPVAAGEADPLTPGRVARWTGAEGHGIDYAGVSTFAMDPRPAVSFLIESIGRHEDVTLVAVGPLTNVGLLAREFPAAIASLKTLSIMGGNYVGVDARSIHPEYNFASDPDAAALAMRGVVPTRMVGLNVTQHTYLSKEHIARIRKCGSDAAELLADAGEHYMAQMNRDRTPMHDVLVLAVLIDPALCEWSALAPYVQTTGKEAGVVTFEKPPRQGSSVVQVATSVDVDRFEKLFVERIVGLVS